MTLYEWYLRPCHAVDNSLCVYPFLPNKYEMLFELPSERCSCTTSLKTSSSIISQRYSLSSSLSFHFSGSKCQNSCNASNLCFSFFPRQFCLSGGDTFESVVISEAGINPVSSCSRRSSRLFVRMSLETMTPLPLHGQSRREWVSHEVS